MTEKTKFSIIDQSPLNFTQGPPETIHEQFSLDDIDVLRQHSSQQIIDWDFISLGFLVYVDAVCRL